MNLLRTFLLWCSTNRWVGTRLPRLRSVRNAVKSFMPGTTAEAALAEAERLGAQKIRSVLSNLGENVRDRTEAEEVCSHYLDVLKRIASRKLDTQISVKPTHLGLDLNPRICQELILRLVRAAKEQGNFIWIDMEGSAYVQRTLDLFRETRRSHDNVGICLQAYLYRTPSDVDSLQPLNSRIRLVKGAYREPENVAYPKKREVDKAYRSLASRLMRKSGDQGPSVAIATHDPRILADLRAVARERGLGKGAYEFQLLYGIGRETQRRLADEGESIRVLISYGENWFPWYMRRLAERPANILFVLRSFFR